MRSSIFLLAAALLVAPACTKKSTTADDDEAESSAPGSPGGRRKKQPPPAERDQPNTDEPVRGHTPYNPNAKWTAPTGHDWQEYPLKTPPVEVKDPSTYAVPPHMKGQGAAAAGSPSGAAAAAPGATGAAAAPAQAEAPDGGQVFMRACAACHGPEGTGEQMRRIIPTIADLTKAEVQQRVDDKAMAELIAKGKGKMPPFEGALTPEQIQAVIKHVRTLKK